jgi:hypothetical protein
MSFYLEHQNEARYSKYPFTDTSSLLDDYGYKLPDDFLIDASMCAWGNSTLYLSSLSQGSGVFSDSSGPVAVFEYSGQGVYPVFDVSAKSEIGCVVLGQSASGIEESKFSPSATTLCPACFCLFSLSKPVVSFWCDVNGEPVEFRGNVRICGKNGVNVTKTGSGNLRIDIIGHNDSVKSCCSDPLRAFIIYNSDCPVVSGTSINYPTYFPASSNDIIPGVIVLHSPLSSDTVCGKKESYIDDNGNIGLRYCDYVPPPAPDNPCSDYNSSMFVAIPSNGNIDFVPFSLKSSGSPVYVKSLHSDKVSSFVSNLSDPSIKNLAIAENSGTVVIGLKGRI